MTDQHDFAVGERPAWLEDLARRAAPSPPKDEARDGIPDRSPRIRTLIKAIVTRESLEQQAVIVRNISLDGMGMASRSLQPTPGEMLRVRLPGQGDLEAQVRWTGEGEFGVRLTRRLDVARVQAVCRQRNSRLLDAFDQLLRDTAPHPPERAGQHSSWAW